MQPPTRAVWDGYYYDGRSAGRRRATITVLPDGLGVVPIGAAPFFWRYREVRQVQGRRPGEPVRLEHGRDLPEVLVVHDPAFLASVLAVAPAARARLVAPGRRRVRIAVAAAATIGAVLTGAALYLLVLPVLADAVAARVPIAWEEEIGRAVVGQGALARLPRCEEPDGVRALRRIVAPLEAAAPASGYTFRVRVLDDDLVNALAAPGGYVVVFEGLLGKTASPEELAGVLAHEMQHVLQRHGTKMLFRELSAAALLAAATGEASQLATVLGAARVFGRLHFSRRFEEAADREGMRMIRAAGIDPNGMVAVMERMGRGARGVPKSLAYLSTHPLTADRVARLRRLAEADGRPTSPLLAEDEWRALKGICGGARPAPADPEP